MGGTGDDVIVGMTKAIENGDGYALESLRNATKNNVNAYLHTNTVNGLSSNSKIVISTPWWEYALYVLIGVFSILTVVLATFFLNSWSNLADLLNGIQIFSGGRGNLTSIIAIMVLLLVLELVEIIVCFMKKNKNISADGNPIKA